MNTTGTRPPALACSICSSIVSCAAGVVIAAILRCRSRTRSTRNTSFWLRMRVAAKWVWWQTVTGGGHDRLAQADAAVVAGDSGVRQHGEAVRLKAGDRA